MMTSRIFTFGHHLSNISEIAILLSKELRPEKTSSIRRLITLSDFNFTNRKKGYVKKEIVGYSMQQMFSVVSDVENYYRFVPYVKKSFVHSRTRNHFKADLIVGFPPLKEVYTSDVMIKEPYHIRSVCNDGTLFNYLLNDWKFSPGLKDVPQSCVIDFKVAFEFRSIIHSNLANLFFDIICEQMEKAFVEEARQRYGEASMKKLIISIQRI